MATTPTAQRPAAQDATSPAKTAGEKPVASFRYGSIAAAIFANNVRMPSGKTATMLDVSLRKSYRDGRGEWAYTHTLGADDLLPAAFLLSRCATFIAETQEAVEK